MTKLTQDIASLKREKDEAFFKKQEAYFRYREACDKTSEAYKNLQNAWEARLEAKEEMNRQYDALKVTRKLRNKIWRRYKDIQDKNNSLIEALRAESNREHQSMQECFMAASDSYSFGDRSEAPVWSQKGHEHRARRDELNAEISLLVKEIRDAKAYADSSAPKVDTSAFDEAKMKFELKKADHEEAEKTFKEFKEKKEKLKEEFEALHSLHLELKNEYHARIDDFKKNHNP